MQGARRLREGLHRHVGLSYPAVFSVDDDPCRRDFFSREAKHVHRVECQPQCGARMSSHAAGPSAYGDTNSGQSAAGPLTTWGQNQSGPILHMDLSYCI